MPLQNISYNNALSWSLSKPITGFSSATQGSDSVSSTLNGINVATYNQLFAAQYALPAAGTQTVDLSAFTNLVGESTGFGHVTLLYVLVTGTNANVAVSPGAANGLVWFFGAADQSVSVPANAAFTFSAGSSGPGAVVDATHKNLLFTNYGSGAATVKVIAVGSTT